MQPTQAKQDVSMERSHNPVEVLMNSEHSSLKMPSFCQEDPHESSSRLQDEKISDDSGTEAKIPNSALAPAGLKNPFWK